MKSPGLLSFSSPHITVSEDVKRQKSPGHLSTPKKVGQAEGVAGALILQFVRYNRF